MPKKKKICFVVSSIYTASIFLKNHIAALSEYYDVYLVANIANKKDVKVAENIGVIAYQHIEINRKISILKDIKAVFKLWLYFRKNKYDAVHSVTPKASLVTHLAAWLACVEVRITIFTGQVWFNMTGIKKKTLILTDKIVVKLATNILVDGYPQRDYLVNHKILKKNQSIVLGHGSICGVNTERFRPDPEIKKRIRKELAIDDNKIVFSFMGRLNKDKGVPELLEVFSILVPKKPNYILILFGSDEENIASTFGEYKTLIPGENFIYYGRTSSPHEHLQVSDIFCFPSHREGFGVSVLEASSLTIPIICSDAYGLMDTIIDNKTGIRHKVKNMDELLNAMMFLAENKEARTEMGNAGRKYITDYFTQEQMTQHWVNYYRSLIK